MPKVTDDPSMIVGEVRKEIDDTKRRMRDVESANQRLESKIGRYVASVGAATDKASYVSKYSVEGISTILCPESEHHRLPNGGLATSVYFSDETFLQNAQAFDAVNQFILSPTSADQFFTVQEPALTQFSNVQQSITFIAAPALREPGSVTQPGISIFYWNGERKYAESPFRCGIIFDYNSSKDCYLNIALDKPHPTQAIQLWDGGSGILNLFNHDGSPVPGNQLVLKETTFRIYYQGTPDGDETAYYTDQLHVHGVSVLPLYNIQDVGNVEANLSVAMYNDNNPPPQVGYLGTLAGSTVWTGHRFDLAIDTQNLSSIKRRVDGANAYACFSGASLDNGWVSGAPFRESALIPLSHANNMDDVASYISTRHGALSKPMQSSDGDGEYGYFIPSLVPDWEEMVNNIRNNPFTGTCDAKKYYQWAIRYIVKPNDVTKKIVTFKGCYVFEGSSDSKLFNPSAAPVDPMWPQYHHILTKDYRIMCNANHEEGTLAKFKECINSVLNYGKSLITVDNVEKVLSKGAEMTIPLIAGALALV